MPKVYHLLTERESFSEFTGGAISRWAANVLRFDEEGIVVACGGDSTWGFEGSRVLTLPALRSYRRLQDASQQKMPWLMRKLLIRRALKRLIRQLEPGDVVWVHNRPEFAAALGKATRRTGARLVLHMHNSHLLNADPKLVCDLQVDSLVFVSAYLQNEVHERYPGFQNVEVLYNGADGGIFFPLQSEPREKGRPVTVMFVSRVVPEKGPDILAEALRSLQRRGVPVEGVIVGGAEFGLCDPTEFATTLVRNAPSNLRFHPYCVGKQLGDLLREADIFCMPSTWQEPLSMAVLEAMATGLPVVASRSGGIPEALAYGGGLLVARGSVEELASAIEKLVVDPLLRMRLAREALTSFTDHFRWQTVAENYQGILKGVIRNALETEKYA